MRATPYWIVVAALGALAPACGPKLDHLACPNDDPGRTCVAGGDRPAAARPDAPDTDDRDAGDDDVGSDDDAGSEAARAPTWRAILAADLVNARDLGGVALDGGAHVAYGALFRGPPLVLSPAGCKGLRKLGVRTIVDLRIDSERALNPESDCALDQARLVAAPLPVPYNVSPADYIADLDASESMATIFTALGDDAAYPIYFHCTWGRDRTGILAAVILLELGASREAILDEYLLSRLSVGAFPMSLEAALDEIERRGGSTAYLKALGVTQQQLATLHARARSAD
jgi:protein-tyrosine phosphatase